MTALERELDTVVQRSRHVEDRLRTVESKLQSEKDELKKIRSVMAQRSAQFSHDTRKRERESTKLKDKLHQVCSLQVSLSDATCIHDATGTERQISRTKVWYGYAQCIAQRWKTKNVENCI